MCQHLYAASYFILKQFYNVGIIIITFIFTNDKCSQGHVVVNVSAIVRREGKSKRENIRSTLLANCAADF